MFTNTIGGALLHAINNLPNATSSSSSSYSPYARSLWVVALTDGLDNASSRSAKPAVYEALKRNGRISLLVITVGPLKHENSIRLACEASRNKGCLIKADRDPEAIREAFLKAAKLMTGNL